MKNIILTVMAMTLFIIGRAQQQGDSSAANSTPPLLGIMMKNGKPVGYNHDEQIFLLAERYKSVKNINANHEELKNLDSWWTYTCKNINLSQDFIGLAPDSIEISTKVFLQLLTTGSFLSNQNRNEK